MIYINAGESGLNAGLGKAKILRKIQIKKIAKPIGKAAKQISIKNAVKVVKFAAPIATGFIPVGGGIASKLMNSKAGKVVSKVKSSKLAKKAIKLSKTKVGAVVVSQAKPAVNNAVQKKLTPVKSIIPKKVKKSKKAKRLAKGSKGAEVKKLQESLGVKADGVFGPKTEEALQKATGARSVTVDEAYSETATQATPPQATPAYAPEEEIPTPAYTEETEPSGELMPVTQTADFMPASEETSSGGTSPKNNTLLYVGSAVALAGIAYLATKKSK